MAPTASKMPTLYCCIRGPLHLAPTHLSSHTSISFPNCTVSPPYSLHTTQPSGFWLYRSLMPAVLCLESTLSSCLRAEILLICPVKSKSVPRLPYFFHQELPANLKTPLFPMAEAEIYLPLRESFLSVIAFLLARCFVLERSYGLGIHEQLQ